jgi:hypothetical protein
MVRTNNMSAESLGTTNVLLGIMAAVSVLDSILLVVLGVMAYRLYTQAMNAVRDLEQRQVAPLVARVNVLMNRVDAILFDVKDITGRVTDRTERVDAAISNTMGRIDATAGRLRSSVAGRVGRVLAFVQAARVAVDSVFRNGSRDPRREERA